MNPNSKDGFQLLPQQVDHTVTNAQMVVGNDDDDEVVVVTTTATPNHSSERQLFRSKCHPNDIPDVARDVTWYDSFYENDADVIAAFDINHEMLDRNSMLYLYYLMAGIFILLIPLGGIGLIFLLFIAEPIKAERIQNYRRRRTHVAIARQGIYFDQVDEPGSRTIMSRTFASYDQIHKCMVEVEEGCCHFKYYVVVEAKNNYSSGFFSGKTLFKVEGLVGTQKFVDIANAMIERSSCQRESTNSEVQNNVETCESEHNGNHEEEIFVAVAKLV
jgi:hypothetical protein